MTLQKYNKNKRDEAINSVLNAADLSNSAVMPGSKEKWVSCADRLPDIGQPVIACRKIFDGEDGFKEWWFGCCIYREFGFPWVTFDDPNPIQFWMPLPCPPICP